MKSPYSYYIEPFDLTDRPRRFLESFAAILKNSNYGFVLDTYARTSTKCARCTASCQVFQATRDPHHVPCYRSELVLRIYRRYFTISGMIRARLYNSFNLTDEYLDEMAESLYQCTACRRCKLTCPMGIDHGLVTHLGRWALAEIGIAPKALVVATREQVVGKTHNTSAIPVPAMQDTCQFLEEELMEQYGHPIKFPIDVEGAEMVFFPAVSDYLLEPDTLMGNAAVMYATKSSWTIGSGYFDGINYGLFYSDRLWDQIVRMEVAELRRLKAKVVLIGECGHASRSAKVGIPNFCGGDKAPPVINIMEYTHRMLEEGKLKVRPNTIKERVTYHDPCNIARSGWIIKQPREILKAICADYVDMTPKGTENICCGGGGGTVSIDEIRTFRTGPGGKVKAEQIRRTGAKYLVAPCANCKKQLREVCEDNDLPDVEVVGLHDLLIKAIDFGPAPETPELEMSEKEAES
jgi:Fe-S oxidoreductase